MHTLNLTPDETASLRWVVQQHVNSLTALDEPKHGNSRLSDEGRANLARLRGILNNLKEIA